MKVLRKNITNTVEIQEAMQHNQQVNLQHADMFTAEHYMHPVPKPIFEEVEWNFKLVNLNSYWIDNSEPYDVFANVAGEGHVRLVNNPLMINQFEMYLSLFV